VRFYGVREKNHEGTKGTKAENTEGPVAKGAAMNLPADARRALAICLGICGLAALGALVASCVWTPAEMAAGAPLELFGIGMSRAFAAASRLRFDEALDFNRGVLVAYPAAALLALGAPLACFAELRHRSRRAL
jgi:hypothetical protein